MCAYTCIHICEYGVATRSRRLSKKNPSERRNSTKENYTFKEPTNRSHQTCVYAFISSLCHVYEACQQRMKSCHTYKWIMWHIWMSHVAQTNKSWHTHTNQLYHTHEWVMSHVWMSHVAQTNKSRHIHMNQSRRTYWSALGNLMFERRAKVLTFFRRTPKMMCVLYINTQRFKREHMAHPHVLWELV